jgi:glycosyltransferase involved in cell wall biosynthesis
MELEVLSEADKVVTVSWSWASDFEEISGRKDLLVIPNGYDSADFQLDYRVNLDEKFTLSHIGSMNGDRNPSALWEAIADVCKQKSDFQDLQVVLVF